MNERCYQGHKVFVTNTPNSILLEAVNDERPLVRMAFYLDADSALEIAGSLIDAARACGEPEVSE